MENTEFQYRRKPAFISFLPVYVLCFGIAYFLIKHSPSISGEVNRLLFSGPKMPVPDSLKNLPYGIIFSIPLLVYGIRKVLWNLMSLYEFSSSEIHLLTGSLTRKERFFTVPDFVQISFRQNLFEAIFGVGSLVLTRIKTGKRLTIKGVYRVKTVVDALRSGLGASY
jgi:hypothetical protein